MCRPAPKRVEKVMGKYDFDGSDPDDLPFKKGELLTVVSKVGVVRNEHLCKRITSTIIIGIFITRENHFVFILFILFILFRTRSSGGPPEIPLARLARYLYLMLQR